MLMIRPIAAFIIPRDAAQINREWAAKIRVEHGIPVIVMETHYDVTPRDPYILRI